MSEEAEGKGELILYRSEDGAVEIRLAAELGLISVVASNATTYATSETGGTRQKRQSA